MADRKRVPYAKRKQPKTRASKSVKLPDAGIKKPTRTKANSTKIGEAIKEFYPELPDRHLAFFVAYIENGGNATEAYLEVNPKVTRGSAGAIGSKILSTIDVGLLLDLMGFSLDSVQNALQRLYDSDPDKFMKYQVMLRKWDTRQVELSGRVEMPQINIVTAVKEEDE